MLLHGSRRWIQIIWKCVATWSLEGAECVWTPSSIRTLRNRTNTRELEVLSADQRCLFSILKAPCFRTSAITTRGCQHGPHLSQEHHHKAEDALRVFSKGKKAEKVDLGPMAKRRDLQGVSTGP